MSFLKKILNKENLHHAYCIEGNPELVLSELTEFLEENIDFKTHGNPDFWHGSFETFSIDESRKLKERQEKTAFGGTKIFVLSFSFITREAQNSLLKVFEEPTPQTHFFILTPTSDVLLPTLRSRLVVLRHKRKEDDPDSIKKFIQSTVAKRLVVVKSFIEEKDRSGALDFLSELESYAALQDVSKLSQKDVLSLQEMSKYKKFLFVQGSSIKLVLEHVALTLPVL